MAKGPIESPERRKARNDIAREMDRRARRDAEEKPDSPKDKKPPKPRRV